MQNVPPQANWLPYLIGFGIFALVFTLRWRRMTQDRPLKVERLWVVPVIYLGLASFLFWRFPPHGLAWIWCAVALGMGAALGWQRGRMMRISVDPETHAISQRGSPAAMLFLLGIIALRYVAREAAVLSEPVVHIDVMTITDILIAFALGLLTMQRVEMYLRARRLLEAARAG